jgi:hypothetical protein
MFLEERITVLERQVAFLGKEIAKLQVDLARLSTTISNTPPRATPVRPTLTTKEAARLLNRAPQTLRVWAMYQNGPVRPLRVNGRLLWATEDVMKLIKHGDQ